MDLTNIVIITDRLRIIPTSEKYANDIFMECTPEIARFLSFDPTGIIEDTIKYIRSSQEKIKSREEMPVVILDKISNEFIGCGGIHEIKTKKPELGLWIKKSAHRKGYGKETISAFINWIKANLEFEYISYPVAKENIPSRKLIESLGGIVKGERIFTSPTGKVLDEVEYRIFLNLY
jgi:RimJ/RimL family protein N-acetyltransferase